MAVESPERASAGRVRRHAAAVATAVAVPLTVVLVLLLNRPGGAPAPTAAPSRSAGVLPAIRVAAPPPPSAAGQRSCQELISALPTMLGSRPARPVDSPSPYVVAWGEPPVVLRCGVPRPAAFGPTAQTLVISGVTWFAERRGSTTAWTVLDRPVYVEVVAPADDASEPVARLATPITRALPRRPLNPR